MIMLVAKCFLCRMTGFIIIDSLTIDNKDETHRKIRLFQRICKWRKCGFLNIKHIPARAFEI